MVFSNGFCLIISLELCVLLCQKYSVLGFAWALLETEWGSVVWFHGYLWHEFVLHDILMYKYINNLIQNLQSKGTVLKLCSLWASFINWNHLLMTWYFVVFLFSNIVYRSKVSLLCKPIGISQKHVLIFCLHCRIQNILFTFAIFHIDFLMFYLRIELTLAELIGNRASIC